ncbi:hypothetical protein [Piscinibacter sp.]|jgi:carbamoyl-phosphate synthase large subunit|uniref:hypothetical protein n=1 Tax=Piscinibacter sp. TaxID=1903157 RepID=UPI002F41709E
MGSRDRFIEKGSRRAWTQSDVVALMDQLYPLPDGVPSQRVRQQRLRSAFLAGAAEAQGELLPRPSAALIASSIQVARALLKNRAASPESRLWHAFMAGAHAAREEGAQRTAPLKLFIRQPFTESDQAQQGLIAAVLAQIDRHNGDPYSFRYLTGRKAESADTFRASFEAESGQPFVPQAFRAYRLNLLAQAEAFINIRVGMSESSAFELCFHIFKGACTPVLFLVWKHAPIKTTLLKDLGNLCDVTYLEFEHADDLRPGIDDFFRRHPRDESAAAT